MKSFIIYIFVNNQKNFYLIKLHNKLFLFFPLKSFNSNGLSKSFVCYFILLKIMRSYGFCKRFFNKF